MKRVLLAVSAMVIACVARVSADDHLGYLFTTPKQRIALDRLPLKNSQSVVTTDTLDTVAPKDEPVKKVKVGGLVTNSKGKNITWINRGDGSAVSKSDKQIKQTGANGGKVDVQLPEGKSVSLKPGQEFDTETGKVRETYQNASDTSIANTSQCHSTKSADGDTRIVCEPKSEQP